MSDARDKPTEEGATDEEPKGPIGGERLAAARREQQVSVLEIAKELHLDEPKVRALERNEFDVIGAPVFAKGHLRKYAQLVGVDEADVMADYYQLNRTAGIPPLVSHRRRPRREMSPGPWIAVVVVLVVVATAYWWITTPRPVVSEPAGDLPVQTEMPEVPADVEQVPAEVGEDDSAILQSVDDATRASAAETAEGPTLGDGQMRVLLTYSGDCWTEITDAGGRRLFFDLGKDGRTVELSGEAPFNALFGNADNVRILVNGSERVIAAAERRGRTARLSIAGS
ncbi:MAG: RodZ domain-containing protein [Woeseiaceae bacterium]